MSKNSAWRSVYEHDYYGRKQRASAEATCTLLEQSTHSPNNTQMETKNFDTMNDNSFGQLKYSSNAVQDIASKSSTEFGAHVSRYTLQPCRLCVVQFPITILISIFDNQRVNRNLKMIETCLPVKMHKNDGLPHYICCLCVVRLEECYEMLQKFHRAYDKHRETIILTDEQNQIHTTSMSTVTVSSQTESTESSSNNVINDQNVNKMAVAFQYKCSVCFKSFESQNDLNCHCLSEHRPFKQKINVSTTDENQAKPYVKKKAANNDVKQCANKDENIQNNTQCLEDVNKMAVTMQYKCSVCFKWFDSQNDVNAHCLSEHRLFKQKMNVSTTDEKHVKKKAVNNDVKQCTNKHENKQNNTQCLEDVNKMAVAMQYKCSVCFKWFDSQNDLNAHCLSEHRLFKQKMNVSTTDEKQMKKKAVNNDVKQCTNKDENKQNSTQFLEDVAGSTDSEINRFSVETSSKKDTADVCSSPKSAEVESGLDNDTLTSVAALDVPKIWPKTSELACNDAKSIKYKVNHRSNSPTFTIDIGIKENTPSAVPLKETTNNHKIVSSDKIKLVYQCLHCHRLFSSQKLLSRHCINYHNMSRTEKIICRQLQTIVTETDAKPGKNSMTDGENVIVVDTSVETNKPVSVQYAYKCGQCSIQLPTREDMISHCLANTCVNAQNQIIYQKVPLKSNPVTVQYPCKRCDATFTVHQDRILHTLECHSWQSRAKELVNAFQSDDKIPKLHQDSILHTLENHSKENKAKETVNTVQSDDKIPKLHPDSILHTLLSHSKQSSAKATVNTVQSDDKIPKLHQDRILHTLECQSKENKAKETISIQPEDQLPKLTTRQLSRLRIPSKQTNSRLCMYCGVVRTKYCLKFHERIHTNERPYQCAHCPKTFRSLTARANHSEIHDHNKNYICHQCGRVCNTQKRLSAHMKTHISPTNRRFACEICGKRFIDNYKYRRHKNIHVRLDEGQAAQGNSTHSQLEHKCTICKKVLKSAENLEIHIRKKHVNKVQYTCQECGKTFNSKYRYRTHGYSHTGEKPFKCNICDKAFRCLATRRQHILVHQSEAPYMCDICGKRFKRKGHLKQHKQYHAGDKPYTCNVCGAGFLYQKRLNDHQKVHNGTEEHTEVIESNEAVIKVLLKS